MAEQARKPRGLKALAKPQTEAPAETAPVQEFPEFNAGRGQYMYHGKIYGPGRVTVNIGGNMEQSELVATELRAARTRMEKRESERLATFAAAGIINPQSAPIHEPMEIPAEGQNNLFDNSDPETEDEDEDGNEDEE